jgi:protein-tyrosine-phosphatase
MPSILLVCTANQCRSPMAMALLRKRLGDLNLEEAWVVDSAGTWGMSDMSATEFAIETIAERGLDLLGHRSQQVTEALLEGYDLVLTMTQDHQEAIQTEFPQHAGKIWLLSEMVREQFDIQDPIGMPLEAYRETADLLDRILEDGIDRILELARSNATDKAKG